MLMKREQRIFAITGDEDVIVGVLYRGKVSFESLDVKICRDGLRPSIILDLKYLDQARTIFIDEKLLALFNEEERRNVLASLLSSRGKNVMIVKEPNSDALFNDLNNTCISNYIPEALNVARKILYEIRNVIGKTS